MTATTPDGKTPEAERAAQELLPCPFCSGAAVKIAYDRGIDIGCESCGYTRHFPGLLQTVPNDKPILEYRNSDGSTITLSAEDATEFYHHDANECALAAWNRRAAPSTEGVVLPPKQSIGDDPEFQDKVYAIYNAGMYNDSVEKSLNALIAYIDARTAGAAPEEVIEIGNRMATTLEVLATALKNPGTAEGVRRMVEEWRAAAPQMDKGREEGND